MSFRRFIIMCALYAGCAAFLGWILGMIFSGKSVYVTTGLLFMFLGLLVILVLLLLEAFVGLVEGIRNVALGQVGKLLLKILLPALLAAVSGYVVGIIVQWIFNITDSTMASHLARIFGWTVVGTAVGVSLAVPDFLTCLVKKQSTGIPIRRMIRAGVGGMVGGIIGSIFFILLKGMWDSWYEKKLIDVTTLWSPSAGGFIILGMCIGLAIALAQVLLREVWIKVEEGFRPGREVMLSKPETAIGRAEACDIGLFGDPSVEKIHARIRHENGVYELMDIETAGGTFLNNKKISGPVQLRSGDVIRVGNNVLSFHIRAGARSSSQGAPATAAPAPASPAPPKAPPASPAPPKAGPASAGPRRQP